MGMDPISEDTRLEVKLEKSSSTTVEEIIFDWMSLNARSRRGLISS